jgi:hypothetical protein
MLNTKLTTEKNDISGESGVIRTVSVVLTVLMLTIFKISMLL